MTTAGTVPIAPSFMFRPSDRERQVLFVSAPKFNLALAAQRHPFPGSLNGIQVRFITNIDLVGPRTSNGRFVNPGSSSLESGFEDAVSGYGIWSRSKGTLLLTLGKEKSITGLYVTANRTRIVTSTIPGTAAPEMRRTTSVIIEKTLITRDNVAARSNLATLIDSMGPTGECAMPSLDVISSASFLTCPSELRSECCPSYR